MSPMYGIIVPWDQDRSTATKQYLYFVTNKHLLCAQHTRGAFLQPFTKLDYDAGFGTGGCAFCPGGALAGHFYEYRSRKAILKAVNALGD